MYTSLGSHSPPMLKRSRSNVITLPADFGQARSLGMNF